MGKTGANKAETLKFLRGINNRSIVARPGNIDLQESATKLGWANFVNGKTFISPAGIAALTPKPKLNADGTVIVKVVKEKKVAAPKVKKVKKTREEYKYSDKTRQKMEDRAHLKSLLIETFEKEKEKCRQQRIKCAAEIKEYNSEIKKMRKQISNNEYKSGFSFF